MHYSDVSVLIAAGFTYGISSLILWGTDNTGNDWQVIEDGEWLKFGKRRTSGGVDTHKPMTVDKFYETFV